ncbi:hypothetical protein D081_1996 [Anaerovibrio sp. JC8]|uniref:SIMPL domain-containing protein n=1 Tax=Anaerovibrio sp. JC8 TaxID=1240085 RepID=UPI000A0C19D2|nr:SIMPL domain-containing protein [Anaerovibrio sp. JC8]ORT99267.1 hypothetical protein D081_1996 [Anaerovibrio sp. JC8]
MDRVIKVTGRGSVTVEPDIVCLHAKISDFAPTYDAAVKMSTAMTELLRVSIQRLEFNKDDLKTEFFEVDTVYEDETDEDGGVRSVLKGYRYNHGLILEIPLDTKLVTACLTEFTKCAAHPEFRIAYTVKAKEAVKDMVLARAVSSARGKAEILAQAAGVTLGPIQTIEYSWNDERIASATEPVLTVPGSPETGTGMKLNITPKSIQMHDVVTVIWSMV